MAIYHLTQSNGEDLVSIIDIHSVTEVYPNLFYDGLHFYAQDPEQVSDDLSQNPGAGARVLRKILKYHDILPLDI